MNNLLDASEVAKPESESTAWELERRSYIGGTDVPKIIGVAEYGGPIDVFMAKIGQSPEFVVSGAIKRGRHFENGLISWYTEETGNKVEVAKRGVRHRAHKFLGANPDKIISDLGDGRGPGILEAKTVGIRSAGQWGYPPDGLIPNAYFVQANWYCHILGLSWFSVVAYIEGREDLQIYEFDYDEELGRLCEEESIRFWTEHVVPQIAPAPDASDAYSTFLKKKFPEDTGEVLDASEEVSEICAELREVTQEGNELFKKRIELENNIKAFMGDASVLRCPAFEKPFTWKKNKPTVKVDWEAFASHYLTPEQLEEKEEFTTKKEGARVFLAPWSRDKS